MAMNSRDVLDIDWAGRARRLLEENGVDAGAVPEIWPAGTYNLVEPDDTPDNILYRVLSNPTLNRGLVNTASAIPDAVLGVESGNGLVDYGAANLPGVGAAAILAAGGMPGLVDVIGAHELKNAASATGRVLRGAYEAAAKRAARGELFGSKGGFLGPADNNVVDIVFRHVQKNPDIYNLTNRLRKYRAMDRGGFDNMARQLIAKDVSDADVIDKYLRAAQHFESVGEYDAADLFKLLAGGTLTRSDVSNAAAAAVFSGDEFAELKKMLMQSNPELFADETRMRVDRLARMADGMVTSDAGATKRLYDYLESTENPTMEGVREVLGNSLSSGHRFTGKTYADELMEAESPEELREAFKNAGIDRKRLDNIDSEIAAKREQRMREEKLRQEAMEQRAAEKRARLQGFTDFERRVEMLEKNPRKVRHLLDESGQKVQEWLNMPDVVDYFNPEDVNQIRRDTWSKAVRNLTRFIGSGNASPGHNYNLFTTNPRKAAQEIFSKDISIEDYLGDRIGDIRPGQRKQVENELRKLGVDIPEEVVEAAPVVEKKVKVKEVQIPKSEQQRLQAIETAQKTWKREPNKVFKSISKGRSPEDYFKGAENIPDDFADKYAQYLADKEGRKAAQAAEVERAAQAAEVERQNAAATSKQIEREEADRMARERIAEERAKAEAKRAAEKAAYDARRPSAVLAAGWKPEEHPLNIYVDAPTEPARYATMDSRANPFTPEEKRDLFVADSIAGEVLRNLAISDKFAKTRIGGPRGISSSEARHRDDLTNYEKLWPQYARKMDEARELGLLSDNVKRTKKPTPNKDGSINMVDTDVIELSHPANSVMNAIYGDGKSGNILNLYDLMFRRNLDDLLHEKNRFYMRQLNTQEKGTKASRILESLRGR